MKMCKYNHKKAIKNKCLSISITLALMSCVLLPPSAQANTIDMTNADNLVIEKYSYGTDNVYTYAHDSSNPVNIKGGNIKINKIETGADVYSRASIDLQTDNTGIDMNDNAKVLEILNALAGKLTCSGDYVDKYGGYYAYNINASATIMEGLTAPKTTLRSGSIGFDESVATSYGDVSKLNYVTFTTPITGDSTQDAEYASFINTKGIYDFSKITNVTIRPKYKSTNYDCIYAAIRPSTNKAISYKGRSYNGNTELIVDAANLQDSKAFGIYNDKNSEIDINDTKVFTINVAGKGASAGIYAGLQTGEGQSYVGLKDVDIQGTGSSFNGIQSMRNGLVDANTVSVSTNSGYGLYASNGGKIIINNLKMNGNDSDEVIYAEKGGNISIGSRNGVIIPYVASIVKGDAVANTGGSIDFALGGDNGASWQGNASGTVNVSLTNGTSVWTGNAVGDGNIKITGGTWKGSASGAYKISLAGNSSVWRGTITDEINTLVLSSSASWINNNYSTATEIDNFVGANKAGDKGAIYQDGTKGITMDKYSGNSLIIFTRDKNAPLDVQGGDVVIKSAQKTDNINAGIVLRTDNDGINTSDQVAVKKVLDNLSNKLVYSGYTQGERNLDGRVEIAEGLTSTAAYCKYSAINFDDKTGRGTSDTKVTSPYLTAITGSIDSDSEYKKDGVTTENGIYNFNKDVVIATNYDVNSGYSPEITTPLGNGSYSVVTLTSGSINNEGNADVTINMNGNDLHIDNKTTVGRKSNGQYYVNRSAGIFAEKEGTITINNPGAMNIENNADYYYAAGLYTSKGNIIINNDADIAHAVKIRGNTNFQINWTGIKTFGGSVKVKGLVDIYSDGAWSLGAAGGEISLGGGKIISDKYVAIDAYSGGLVSVNTSGAGDELVAGNNDVTVKGNILTQGAWVGAGNGGTINLGLTTNNSQFIGLANRAVSSTGAKIGTFNLFLQNGATWTNQDGWQSADDGAVSQTATTSSNVDIFKGGTSEDKCGVIIQKNINNIVLEKYSGYTHVMFNHDSTDPKVFSVGNIIINSANKTDGNKASITLLTDSSGIDTKDANKVIDVLGELAKKLTYTSYGVEEVKEESVKQTNDLLEKKVVENNLDGKVGIAEGLTSTSAIIRLGDIAFNADNGGAGALKDGSVISITPTPSDPSIIYGSSETAMMRGAKAAMTSSILAWRAENDDFGQRVGDLRKIADEDGIWCRIYGGKNKYAKDGADYSNSFKTMQVGIDRAVGDKGWHAGGGFSYMDGDSEYNGGGKGDNKSYGLAIYGSWLGSGGQYLDLVLKENKLNNNYTVYNDMGHKLTGDYDAWGTSLSAEYGRKFSSVNGVYVEPQAQITYSRLSSGEYNAHSDFGGGKDMHVEQEAMNSLVGRLGVGLGKDVGKTSFYAKVSLAHEFCGNIKTTFSAINEPTSSVSQDFGDTWVEFNIGGSRMISKNTYLYADFTKSAGADLSVDWKTNVGVRWVF